MILAILLLAQASATPRQFDLVCTGTRTTTYRLEQPTTKPWTARIAIDLDAGASRWNGAVANRPVAEMPDAVVFLDTGADPRLDQERVSRSDGRYSRFETMKTGSGSVYGHRETVGQCERTDFSGLAGNKF